MNTKFAKHLLAVLAALSLAACATQARYETQIQQFVGKPISVVMDAWNYPSGSFEAPQRQPSLRLGRPAHLQLPANGHLELLQPGLRPWFLRLWLWCSGQLGQPSLPNILRSRQAKNCLKLATPRQRLPTLISAQSQTVLTRPTKDEQIEVAIIWNTLIGAINQT